MPHATDPSRDLLFGLLALQIGLIEQDQLVTAFRTWTRDKSRLIADLLVSRGDLDLDQRAGIEGMVALHLKKHGGDMEKSLAAIPAGRSACQSLACLTDADIEASLTHLGPPSTLAGGDPDRTTSYAVGSDTSGGQRFRVLRPHARGGLGAVFVALDCELHREVALKQVLEQHADDPVSRSRFLLEAEVTGGLEHPGIVPVYGLGTYADGRPYYAMRFIRGDSLKEAIERFHADTDRRKDPGRRSLELRKLLRRFLDVCNAIGYAHSRGVLHRDIKPANIIVGKHGETLVVDWGLAKASGRADAKASEERPLVPSASSGSAETLPGSTLGTPGYMSPEQARGRLDLLGPQADVYSLGATLYCLLTGKPPFAADDVGGVLRAVQLGDFLPPRQLDPSIDKALELICLKAMALEPESRYGSCKDLADDIERWMADERVSAWREPWTRSLVRWMTRHRTGVTAAGAAILVAMAGLGAVSGVQARANGELKRANTRVFLANTELKQANDNVTRANEELQAANVRERQQFNLAMDAIKLFHGEVSEDLLLKEKQFHGLRTELLRGAAGFYDRLESLLRDQDDLPSRRALGTAYAELSELTRSIGSQPDALAIARKALAVRRELARHDPVDHMASLDVARSMMAIGLLLSAIGDTDHAIQSDQEARSILLSLADAAPNDPRFLIALARCDNDIGKLLSRQGNPESALASYQRAQAVQETLAKDNPSSTEIQGDFAATLENLGWLLSDSGKTNDAISAYKQALVIQRKLAEANPSVARFQSELASSYGDISWLLLDAGDATRAAESQNEAMAIRRKLADENPAVTHFQTALADSFFHIASQFNSRGKPALALEAIEQARSILQKLAGDHPTVTWYRSELAIASMYIAASHQQAGRYGEAIDALHSAGGLLERLEVHTPEVRYNLACVHARLAGIATIPRSGLSGDQGRAEGAHAVHWLRSAIAQGMRNDVLMRRDSDLDPLRDRPDFQLLLLDLAFPSEPFAGAE